MADVELAAPGPPPALPPRPSDSNSREPSTNAPPTVLQRHHSVDPNGTQQTPYNPSSQSQLDLYAADRARSPCAYVWYRWFNPWVRWLTILVVLYLYALSSGVLTYRGNTFQDEMQVFVNHQANPNDPEHPMPGDPASTRPERETGYTDYYGLDGRDYVPFVLRDLFFDFIPALQGSTRDGWYTFANFTPIFFNIVMLLMLLIRMDIIRWTEYIAVQWVLFAVNALIHVSTTYPDAGGYQDTCREAKYHEKGSWMYGTITTSYCNDMMWSGHTQNTLVPMIMIKRLMWDFLGWNIAFSAAEQLRRAAMLEQQPHLFVGYHNEHERQMLYEQYAAASAQSKQARNNQATAAPHFYPSSTTGASDEKQQANKASQAVEQYAPQYSSTKLGGMQLPTQQADDIALQRAENFDVHINVHAATTVHPHQRPNYDHDAFFKIYKSPYRTPDIVERARPFWAAVAIFVRIALPIWFGFLIVSLLLIRFHYSADILVAIFATCMACTNTHMLQGMVRLMYRPYYHNYLYGDRAPHMPVYLRWPLNAEQVNYEERVRRVGIGGVL